MNKSDFQKVVKAASIREVFMVSADCKCHIHYSLVEPEHTILNIKPFTADAKFNTSKETNKGVIVSTFSFTVEGVSKKDIKTDEGKVIRKKNEPLFTISASYVVIYDVNDINLKEDAVTAFGKENALFNIYPYLREFITHIGQRLNLRPIFIPLLKPDNQLEEPVLRNKTKVVKSGKKKARIKS